MRQILECPYSHKLAELPIPTILIDRLEFSLTGSDPYLQVLLLDTLSAAIRLHSDQVIRPTSPMAELKRPSTQENMSIRSRPSTAVDHVDAVQPQLASVLPGTMVKCLQSGLSAQSSRIVLDSWVAFLIYCLPLYADTIFKVLIPLTDTLCMQIGQTFDELQRTFSSTANKVRVGAAPESLLISLLNGLEHLLARGHERLLEEEAKPTLSKSPEQVQGFFGNMVSGVFNSETPQSRSITANNRLTVLLSIQDTVRICYRIWSWGGLNTAAQDEDSLASFNYTSLRMRNRARRLLEHLFEAEALECLEIIVEIWQNSMQTEQSRSNMVFDLLHVLDGSRPRHTMPAIFNAIYTRNSPGTLDPSRKSTMTSTVNDIDLVVFLVEYARTLEDDSMDEIWADCMSFLKDLLANPFPHRQTLPSLLEFAAILGEKVDNTNFGEQRRMRKDLAVCELDFSRSDPF